MAKQTLTTRVTALESDVAEVKSDIKLLLALVQGQQPAAVVAPPAPVVEQPKAEDKPFVEWIRETAPARKARKESNAQMAAWMRSKGLVPNGAAWEACKKGERNVRTLKALQK